MRDRVLMSVVCALGAVLAGPATPEAAGQNAAADRQSVVKIFSTVRAPSLFQPWTRPAAGESSGSGVIIEGNRILTNAHVVNYARRILVQPNQSSDKYEAEVVAIAHGIDLAVLELDDESFFDEYPAAALSDELPTIGGTVTALGYPLGGEALSITEGIVSRIEHTGYKGDTLGLRIQVDVALNPGNSGGPVFRDGTVIGLVFSGIPSAENIGYVIPTDEIQLFLNDVADGAYDGNPRFFGRLQTAENDAVRSKLGLSRDQTGLIVSEGDDAGVLERWDVIDAIGPHDIDNRGMADVPGGADLRLNFSYFIPKLAEASEGGTTVPMTVLRGGEAIELDVPVMASRDLLIKPLAGEQPSYLIYGPMAFTPAYQELMQQASRAALVLASDDSPLIERLTDTVGEPGEQLVIVPAPFFPHRLTKGYEVGVAPVLESVNGTPIKNLAQLQDVLESIDDEYTEFVFAGSSNETLVFKTDELREATEEVLDDGGIRSATSDDLR
ncbi:MAG: trypsin-like peptidase domain-containing protein [Planctomycetota bacterium]